MAAESDSGLGRNAQQEALKRAPPATAHSKSFAVLAVAVLGVVYGDIGTSPIYALRECFAGKNPIPVTAGNVLGVLSLVFWTLVLVISLKYMVYVLRADNRGEGGIFALIALLRPDRDQDKWRRRVLILLGILGASMLYGGAMITPAISVLSAVEGLGAAAPATAPAKDRNRTRRAISRFIVCSRRLACLRPETGGPAERRRAGSVCRLIRL